MIGLGTLLSSILNIGKDYLTRKSKEKTIKQDQEFKILEAETKAIVNRLNSNTNSDNLIDEITARNKRYTYKDEFITYLFLTPVFTATIVPFIKAFKSSKWEDLNIYTKQSYENLTNLPHWYLVVVFLIVVDVLAFRSFARKVIDKYIDTKFKDKK